MALITPHPLASAVPVPASFVPGLAASATDSARRAGGPQDLALYVCGCGNAFKASVSTSVGCPRCGSAQAW